MHIFARLAPLWILPIVVACGGSTESQSGSSDEDLSVSATACKPITSLKCKKGFVVTETGCLQSHVEGATPFGKCVAAQACISVLDCAANKAQNKKAKGSCTDEVPENCTDSCDFSSSSNEGVCTPN